MCMAYVYGMAEEIGHLGRGVASSQMQVGAK